MNPGNSLSDQELEFHKANALRRSGRLAEAETQYRKLLISHPQSSGVLSGLGTVSLQMGKLGAAIKLLGEALKVEPNQQMACFNLGTAFYQKGMLNEALACYDRVIAINPDYPQVHVNRGILLEKLKRFGKALASYDRAISIQSDAFLAHYNRAALLERFDRGNEALSGYDRAIAIKPDYYLAHVNRGALLEKLNRSAEALTSFERAIALKPDQPLLYVNCGVILQNEKRFDEALASYERAITLKPDYAEAYWFKSLLKLLLGEYIEGWQLHEWRWQSRGYKNLSRNFTQPLWLGEQSIQGKTLLIHAEVGLGDSIQFCRYVPMLEAMGAKVILEIPAALAPVVTTLKGDFTIVGKGSTLPEFDYHCPAMSLPLVFRTNIETIPSVVPYFHADPEKLKVWQQRLGKQKKPRVGLVWSGLLRGNIDFNPAKKRSIPLELLEPILSLPLEFHSLQKDIKPEDANYLERFTQVHTHQEELGDFADTAALIQEMDMVISIDTSVAHLSGALGKPLWVLLPLITDYRWTPDGATTPWYPTATLFRQAESGDWTHVVADVAQRLEATLLTKPKAATVRAKAKPKAKSLVQSALDI